MKTPTVPLILASASPRRKALLTRLGLQFEIRHADIDETPEQGESARQMTERLAQRKAHAIASKSGYPVWVLGSDTTVALNERVFGKPNDREEAIATLSLLSENTHQVISSISLVHSDPAVSSHTTSVISQVRFGRLSKKQISDYCNTDEPYDKAGAYGIQGLGGIFVEHIDGDYSAIMGLPLWATGKMLRSVGLLG